MNLNTKSPDYHKYIQKRDSRMRVKLRNKLLKFFRRFKYAFKNS